MSREPNSSINLTRRIVLFYLLTIAYSWPVLFLVDGRLVPAYHATAFVILISLFGHMAAMMGPMLAGIAVLRFFQKRRLLDWKGARVKYFLYAASAGALVSVLPAMLYLAFGSRAMIKSQLTGFDILFLISYLGLGWFAGIGEEYGWTGFLLTELTEETGKSRAIVVSGCLRGLWHLPVLAIPVYLELLKGTKTLPESVFLIVVVAIQLIVSNVFFSALFGFVWYRTASVALVGWMHFMFDFFRDLMILLIVGFSTSIWLKLGYVSLFVPLAAMAFSRIAKEDGYSNYLQLFYRKRPLL